MSDESSIGRDEELDDHDYQVREVFAQFGVAMYKAQVLEQALVNVLTYAQASDARHPSPEVFDAFLDDNLTVTMGRLLRRLGPFLGDDQQLGTALSEALALRNRLAHSYFREHDRDFFSFTGREVMLAESLAAQEFFTSVDTRLEPVLHRYLKFAGISAAEITSYVKDQITGIVNSSKKRDHE